MELSNVWCVFLEFWSSWVLLGSHRVLGPHGVLRPHRNLGSHRVLGPHSVLSLHWVLDPHRVLGPVSCQSPGSRFSGMPRKTIEIYRVSRKKNIPTIFLGIGAKKFKNSCSLLFKMLMISGKWKKAPTENNETATATSSESG